LYFAHAAIVAGRLSCRTGDLAGCPASWWPRARMERDGINSR
jgi:hypothetical protein